MRRTALILLWAVALTGTSFGARAAGAEPRNTEDPATRFANGENHFRYQDYPRAIRTLRPLLYPKVLLTDPAQRHRAREYLAASYWWIKDFTAAREEFTALLLEDAQAHLDPFYYPAPLVQFVEDLRTELRKKGLLDRPARPKAQPVKLTPSPPPWVVSLIPFGVPQFAWGHRTRAWLFLGGQAASFATNLTSALIVRGMRGSDGLFSAADSGRARALRTTWWISGGIFVALYAAGVIDAFVSPPESKPLAPLGGSDTSAPAATGGN